jgi:hypothetical protein
MFALTVDLGVHCAAEIVFTRIREWARGAHCDSA